MSLPAMSNGFMATLFSCLFFISQVSAGSFMAGSIRWQTVGPLQVRFDIVTYWTRSYSIYHSPTPGQKQLVPIAAQNTVEFDFGDNTPSVTLQANVTDVSLEEDWFSAVTVVYHNYPAVAVQSVPVLEISSDGSQSFVNRNTPWTASLAGCCRFNSNGPWHSSVSNDAAGKFVLTALVDLEKPASPDPRNPPRLAFQDAPTNFSVATPIPYLKPWDVPSPKVMWRWCNSLTPTTQSGWSLPYFPQSAAQAAEPAVALDTATGVVTWLGGLLTASGLGPTDTAGYHLCVETCVGTCDWTDKIDARTTSQTDFMLLVYADAAAAAAAPTLATRFAGPVGLVTGRRLSLSLAAALSPAAAAAAAALAGAAAAPGLRLTRGYGGRADYGLDDPLGRFTALSATNASGAALASQLTYLPPPGAEGWSALCFAASLGGGQATAFVSSEVLCIDLLISATDVPSISLSADKFQEGPTAFRLREGQTLSALVSASLVAQDDVASAVVQPKVAGASLVPVSTGTNVARYELLYTPGRGASGGTVEVCVVVSGKPTPGRAPSTGQTCIQVAVERCVWSVREEESLISISQSLQISWLQLWNFNKRWLKQPDVGLETGMPIQVGQLYHAVEGDSLATIATAFSTTEDVLRRLNADLSSASAAARLPPGTAVCLAFASCRQ